MYPRMDTAKEYSIHEGVVCAELGIKPSTAHKLGKHSDKLSYIFTLIFFESLTK